jgi:flagellar P-ring protein precursor FlgI
MNYAKALMLLASLTVGSGCAAPQVAPLLPERAFEPITPVMPAEITSVTGSIFADSNARYRFGFKKNFQVGDIITVVLTEATQAQRQSGVETTREGANSPQAVDVNVATIGLATSLRGGNLILTELRGADGQIYALAQGPLTTTGIEVNAAGSEINIGVPTTARVPNGALIERAVETPFGKSEFVVLNAHQTDFTTVSAISDAINEKFGVGTANPLDARSVAVRAPLGLTERVGFLSMIENIDVIPGEPKARVVVNSRTGTVVISRTVKVTAAAVTQGSLSVSIAATNEVVQPEAGLFGGGGEAVEVQNADIEVTEEVNPMFLFQPGVDLRDIVEAVNQVGASPSSLIAILEALKSSGSLRAELLVI